MRQYTIPDQTAKLIELGFEKPKSIGGYEPSFVVEYEGVEVSNVIIGENTHCPIFAYSISELIEMLMKVIGVRISFDSMHGGRLFLIVKRLVGNKWDILYGKVGKELADLLVDAIVKLKEEGVI